MGILPGCDAASVALVIDGRSTTVAMTDHLALEVDLVQYRFQEGPCLDAVDGGRVVRIDLIDDSPGCQRFAPGAFDLGINSVLSVPLYERDRVIGSLYLYSQSEHGFDATPEDAAQPFATTAAQAIADAPILAVALPAVDENVWTMEEEALIGMALGVVMERRSCSTMAAREALDHIAATRGVTLREAAEAVIAGSRLADSE